MVSIDSPRWRFRQAQLMLVGVVFIPLGVWHLATRQATAWQALSTLGLGLISLGLAFQRRMVATPAVHAAFKMASGVVMTLLSLGAAVGAVGTFDGQERTVAWAFVVIIPVATTTWVVQGMRETRTPDSDWWPGQVPDPAQAEP